MKTVRSLNKEGMAKYRNFIEQLQAGIDLSIPVEFLEDLALTVSVDGFAEIDTEKVFNSRSAAGKYFCEVLSGLDDSERGNEGMWAWLSLVYFDQLCPPPVRGQAVHVLVPIFTNLLGR